MTLYTFARLTFALLPALMPRAVFLLLLFLSIALCGYSQRRLSISVQVHTAAGLPVRNALVAAESSAGGFHTDSSGNATMELATDSICRLHISAPGYAALDVQLAADSSHFRFSYTLQKAGTLEGAVVRGTRPLMRQQGDMTTIDPEPLAASSISGYEVLEKTPGIIADQDGNFFLTSSTAAAIYINGRELKMSTADVATMLRALPPNAIERIEILRTPSAKYDASGSGGIINVVLRKGVKLGLTGSLNAGLQQGLYGNQSCGASLNYSDGETTAYINLNYTRRKTFEQINTDRMLEGDSSLLQDSRTVYQSDNPFLGYGASRSFGEKWTLGYDGRLSGNFSENNTLNENSFVETASRDVISVNKPGTLNHVRAWNIDQSVNAKYKIDTSGSEWSATASWNGAFGHTAQDIFAPSVPGLGAGGDTGTEQSTRHYLALQTDWKQRLPYHITLETGLKTAYTAFRSDADFKATVAGHTFRDENLTNAYRYRENIGAAYLQASRDFFRITVKPGLRLESTYMHGRQTLPGDTSFSIRRLDLFPYLYISRNILRIAKFDLRAYLIYRRTILRPAYDYLNPYLQFIDAYTYNTGNPALRPQFTQNVEANISVDERPVLAIGHNDITDIFSQVVYQSEKNRSVVLRTYDNLGRNRETYLRGLGAIPPGGVYFFVLGGQININRYTGAYQGAPIDQTYTSYTLFTYHNLKLGKKMNVTLNGFARFKGFMQFYELGPFGALNGSVTRYFMDRRLMLTASAQDVFYTNQYRYAIDQGPVHATGTRANDSRRFSLNLRYNFGIKQKDEKRDMGDMEEKAKGAE